MAAQIEGYASAASVAAGETLAFHVRASAASRAFARVVYRRGVTDTLVAPAANADAYVPGAQDDAALAIAGCGWPAAAGAEIVVPASWPSGYYVARLTAAGGTTEIPFFVRAAQPGATSNILVKMSDATAQAYTAWGGRGLYTTPFAPTVSFDRPYDDLALFERYQLPFLRWCEATGTLVELCSSLDLVARPTLLGAYRLVVSLGHDEYWSLEMRDQFEAFIASGGNVLFMSANTCYWQARFDLGGGARTMTCYKETEAGHTLHDPLRDDPRRVTVRWYEPPVNRPETTLTGVSYRYGAGWWNDPIVPQKRYRGYTVRAAGHWMLANTGLADGETFGAGTSVDDTLLGYETDATGAGTPADFVTVASADLSDWGGGGQAGAATMGTYRRNGIVCTTGTVNWAGGLPADGSTNAAATIAQNLLDTLTADAPAPLPLANATFATWRDGVPEGWTLDGAGTVTAANDPDAAGNELRFTNAAPIDLDAHAGETWLGCPNLTCAAGTTYGVGAWLRASAPGATLRLQTTDTWTDFASASHPGDGRWHYVFATGTCPGAGDVPARVKIQIAAGGVARVASPGAFPIPAG